MYASMVLSSVQREIVTQCWHYERPLLTLLIFTVTAPLAQCVKMACCHTTNIVSIIANKGYLLECVVLDRVNTHTPGQWPTPAIFLTAVSY